MLQGMVVVAIGQRELKAAVLHRGSIHCYSTVRYTGICRYRHIVEQVLRLVLVPLSSELNTVVEQSQVDTYVHGLLLLPCNVLINES